MYLEKAMAPHSSVLAWKIPWMEEPGGLQSMGLLRVGHNWATSLSRIGEGNGNPLQCSCLENPMDGGAWWAAVSGVTQSQTWLKWLSSSSSSISYKGRKVKEGWLFISLKYLMAWKFPWAIFDSSEMNGSWGILIIIYNYAFECCHRNDLMYWEVTINMLM